MANLVLSCDHSRMQEPPFDKPGFEGATFEHMIFPRLSFFNLVSDLLRP